MAGVAVAIGSCDGHNPYVATIAADLWKNTVARQDRHGREKIPEAVDLQRGQQVPRSAGFRPEIEGPVDGRGYQISLINRPGNHKGAGGSTTGDMAGEANLSVPVTEIPAVDRLESRDRRWIGLPLAAGNNHQPNQ